MLLVTGCAQQTDGAGAIESYYLFCWLTDDTESALSVRPASPRLRSASSSSPRETTAPVTATAATMPTSLPPAACTNLPDYLPEGTKALRGEMIRFTV